MLELSQAATNEIVRLKSWQKMDALVRLRIIPGGCSEWIYDLSFDLDVKATDQVFTSGAIKIVIDRESLKFVHGLTVDYSEDLMGGAFRFHNPQAIATCSCGHSFSVELTDNIG